MNAFARRAKIEELKAKGEDRRPETGDRELKAEGEGPRPETGDLLEEHAGGTEALTPETSIMLAMGAFSDKAFDIVRRIPRGRVMSYGAVARAIGEPRKSRFVGYAMRNNPDQDIYPCHRVVFKDGAICDSYVFGGPEVQKHLLEQEGVPFLDDTHVDMAKCAWTPGEDTFGRPTDIDWEREIGD